MSRLPEELNRSFEEFEILGDCHHSTSLETPMRADAWELSSETKIQRIRSFCRSPIESLYSTKLDYQIFASRVRWQNPKNI